VSDVYSKCGMRCSHCPWSKSVRETMTAKEYEKFRNRCIEILGFRPTKSFQNCLSCQTPDRELPEGSLLPRRDCSVRICAIKTEVENCAYCSRFPCASVKALGTEWTREVFEAKHGAPIPEEDYLTFIEPFEGLKHLEAIRALIKSDEIVEPTRVPPLKTEIVEFPEKLSVTESERKTFKTLHQLLTTLLSSNVDTYSDQAGFKKQRYFTYNALWIFGRVGELVEEDRGYLVVEGSTFMKEKKRRNLTHWGKHFEILKDYGVNVEQVSLPKKEWRLRMSLDQKVGGFAVLKALKTYIAILDKKYREKALQHLSKADMCVLSEN